MPVTLVRISGQAVLFNRDYTHPLSVDLADVCDTLRKDIAGHLVAELVSELCRLTSRPHHRRTSICYRASHNAANRWRELVDV